MKVQCRVVPAPGGSRRYCWQVVYVELEPSVVLWSHAHYLTRASARAGALRFIERVKACGVTMELPPAVDAVDPVSRVSTG